MAGAILGAILGGAKGAAVGATTGAGAGTAAVVTGDRSAAEFPVGTEVTARILSPVTVTVEKRGSPPWTLLSGVFRQNTGTSSSTGSPTTWSTRTNIRCSPG